jgi:hypothetical protein
MPVPRWNTADRAPRPLVSTCRSKPRGEPPVGARASKISTSTIYAGRRAAGGSKVECRCRRCDWLGHSNISQTSTYLESTLKGQHDAMRRFYEQRGAAAVQDGENKSGIRAIRCQQVTPSRNGRHCKPSTNTACNDTSHYWGSRAPGSSPVILEVLVAHVAEREPLLRRRHRWRGTGVNERPEANL